MIEETRTQHDFCSDKIQLVTDRCLVIGGLGKLSVPIAEAFANAGFRSFVLLTKFSAHSDSQIESVLQVIREKRADASIRIVQVPRYDGDQHLFPEETDLIIDCSDKQADHASLEQACAEQGIPMILATVIGQKTITGLTDPFAGGLSLFFEKFDDCMGIKEINTDIDDQNARLINQKVIFNQQEEAVTEYAVQQTVRHGLNALLHRASFYKPVIEIIDNETGQCVPHTLPSQIPQLSRLVLVGGDHRNVGKTTLCSDLAYALTSQGKDVRVIKVKIVREDNIYEFHDESRDENNTKIQRLFEAGSQRVARLVVSESKIDHVLPIVLAEVYETMKGEEILLCESNTIRRYLQPLFFAHLVAPDGEIKPSAVRTRRMSDRMILTPFDQEDVKELSQLIMDAVEMNR